MFDPGWISAGAACVGASAAMSAAVLGIKTLNQTRRDSRGRSRPMVAAELQHVPFARGSQRLVIRNYGPSVARDVRVSFDPQIEDPGPLRHAHGAVTHTLLERYSKTIPVLTPGTELDNLWFVAVPGPNETVVNSEPIPPQVAVRISYKGVDGEPYDEVFPLDTAVLDKKTSLESSAAPAAMAAEAKQSLDQLVRSTNDLAASLAELVEFEQKKD